MSWISSLFGGASCSAPAPARIDGPTAHTMVAEGALLVDVRTGAEFMGGHLPDALNLPLDQLGRRMDELPSDRPIIVYCRSGARSRRAAGLIAATERGPVVDLGPMSAW